MDSLKVLSTDALLSKVLQRRGLTVKCTGKVWSDELNTFVSCKKAYLAGIGKANRTKEERKVFDLLLVDAAERDAVKWQQQLDRSERVRAKGIKVERFNQDKLLDIVVDIQERMAKGMELIDKAKAEETRCSQRLQAAKAGAYLPKVEWLACLADRNDAAKRKNNLWEHWMVLKEDCNQFASANHLWPAYYAIRDTEFAMYGLDRRPCMRDQGLDFNEKDSGLTGKREIDIIGDLGNAHVTEYAPLQAAYKACEHYRKWRMFRGATAYEAKRDIAWAHARELQRRCEAEGCGAEDTKTTFRSVSMFMDDDGYMDALVQEINVYINQ